MNKKIAIVGTVGVPARYGGFETLVENLLIYHRSMEENYEITVYCSSQAFDIRYTTYMSAELKYLRINANGMSSIIYDIVSICHAIYSGKNTILLLGVSGAIILPFLKLFPSKKVITNIDGIEWKRAKWNVLARAFLRMSEWFAVRFSDVLIADNIAISKYVLEQYGVECEVIAYGGDHSLSVPAATLSMSKSVPQNYCLALCRIEPENNIEMILDAFANSERPLLFIGNWNNSLYGKELREKYKNKQNLFLEDPVYDPGKLRYIRDRAIMYVHGHSAGGTNPSLVEMMHFGIPVLAYDCCFNRYSTRDRAEYFNNANELTDLVLGLSNERSCKIGQEMKRIAEEDYTWKNIGAKYFEVLNYANGK